MISSCEPPQALFQFHSGGSDALPRTHILVRLEVAANAATMKLRSRLWKTSASSVYGKLHTFLVERFRFFSHFFFIVYRAVQDCADADCEHVTERILGRFGFAEDDDGGCDAGEDNQHCELEEVR